MSQLFTVPMPLTFWGRLSTRLQTEVTNQQARALAAANPLVGTVDNAKDDQSNLARAKAQLDSAMQRLDSISMLALALRMQLEGCHFQIGATTLVARIDVLADLHSFYQTFLKDRPSRVAAELAVANLRTAYASASKPPSSDWATVERSRLLGQSVQLPVLSAEEATAYEASAQRLHNDLDSLRAELDSLLATTNFSLSISESLIPVLNELGIGVQAPVEAQPPLEPENSAPSAPAEEPAPMAAAG